MSAFIVAHAHVSAIVSYAAHRAITYAWRGESRPIAGRASEVAYLLFAANVASVAYRYSMNAEQATDEGGEYAYAACAADAFTDAQIASAVACLDYQSCERDDWNETEARAILEGIGGAILRAAFPDRDPSTLGDPCELQSFEGMPGIGQTVWGIDELPAPREPEPVRHRCAADLVSAIRAAAQDAPESFPPFNPKPLRAGAYYLPERWDPDTEQMQEAHGPIAEPLPIPPECIVTRPVFAFVDAHGTRGSVRTVGTRSALIALADKVARASNLYDGKARTRRLPSKPRSGGSATHAVCKALQREGDYAGALAIADSAGAVFFGYCVAQMPLLYVTAEPAQCGGADWTIARQVNSGRWHVLHTACAVTAYPRDALKLSTGFASASGARDWLETMASDDDWAGRVKTAAAAIFAQSGPRDQSAMRAAYESGAAFAPEAAPSPQTAPAESPARADSPAMLATAGYAWHSDAWRRVYWVHCATAAKANELCGFTHTFGRTVAQMIEEERCGLDTFRRPQAYRSDAARKLRSEVARCMRWDRRAARSLGVPLPYLSAAVNAVDPIEVARVAEVAARIFDAPISELRERAGRLAAAPGYPPEPRAPDAFAVEAHAGGRERAAVYAAAADRLADGVPPTALSEETPNPAIEVSPPTAHSEATPAAAAMPPTTQSAPVPTIAEVFERAQHRTPYQYQPLFARIAIERLDADSALRTPAQLDALLDAYARAYGVECSQAERDSAQYTCSRRFPDFPELLAAPPAEIVIDMASLPPTVHSEQTPNRAIPGASRYVSELEFATTCAQMRVRCAATLLARMSMAWEHDRARSATIAAGRGGDVTAARAVLEHLQRIAVNGSTIDMRQDAREEANALADALSDLERARYDEKKSRAAPRETAPTTVQSEEDARAEWEQAQAEAAATQARAESLASGAEFKECGGSVRFTKASDAQRFAVCGPDVSEPGAYRFTYFDGAGPIGHMGFRTLAAACAEALALGYEPIANEPAPAGIPPTPHSCAEAATAPPTAQSEADADYVSTLHPDDVYDVLADNGREPARGASPAEVRAAAVAMLCEVGRERFDMLLSRLAEDDSPPTAQSQAPKRDSGPRTLIADPRSRIPARFARSCIAAAI